MSHRKGPHLKRPSYICKIIGNFLSFRRAARTPGFGSDCHYRQSRIRSCNRREWEAENAGHEFLHLNMYLQCVDKGDSCIGMCPPRAKLQWDTDQLGFPDANRRGFIRSTKRCPPTASALPIQQSQSDKQGPHINEAQLAAWAPPNL